MRMEQVGEGVWVIRSELRLGAGFWMPVCSTVLRRKEGGLVVHSPLDFSEPVSRAIDALGPVEVLVAPNRLHHLFAGQAKLRWPGAKLLGAPGLAEKRADLGWDGVLSPGVLGPEIACLSVEGAPSVSEVVLLHRASKTLVVTDLVFHIREPRGWLTPWILRMVGAHRCVGQSRAWRFLFVEDRGAFAASGRTLMAEDFERVVVAHGEMIERDAKAALGQALSWMLGGAPALPAAQRA